MSQTHTQARGKSKRTAFHHITANLTIHPWSLSTQKGRVNRCPVDCPSLCGPGEQQRITDEVWVTTILPQLSSERLRAKTISDYFYTYHRWSNYFRTVESKNLEQRMPITGTSRCTIAFIENIRARASTTTALIEARRLRRLLLAIDRNLDIASLESYNQQDALRGKSCSANTSS